MGHSESGNSLVVRRVSPGRKTVELCCTKLAAPRQIKQRIFELSIRRGQSNFIYSFSCEEEEDYYRVVFDRTVLVLTAARTASAIAVCKKELEMNYKFQMLMNN